MSKLQTPLSNFDLEQHLGSQRIVKYADLKNYKNLYELMPNKVDYCIVLLEAQKNYGHWTILVRNGKNFSYFNSYGKKYDADKGYISKMMLKILQEDRNEIQRLIIGTGLTKIPYNKVELQGESQTCGRYTTFIAIMNSQGYTPKQAVEFLQKHKTTTYDDLICELV